MAQSPWNDFSRTIRPSSRQIVGTKRSVLSSVTSDVHRMSPRSRPLTPRLPGMIPSETDMLQELPYVLQGLCSTSFSFTSDTRLDIPKGLSRPLVGLLRRVLEPALLYQGIKRFVDSPDPSLIGQSFRLALTQELQAYLQFVTSLEGEIKREDRGVTLRRCAVWLLDSTLNLRLLSRFTTEAQGKKGGEIISIIHEHSRVTGDPLIREVAERVVAVTAQPFYAITREWIYDGELRDPFGEFFVAEKTNQSNLVDAHGRPIAASMWKDKFRIEPKMVPSIISPQFAETIFMIGKSLNFLRYTCEDAAWVEDYSERTSRELKYGDTVILEETISSVYKTTMARVIELMMSKFHLLDHLNALKRYLLLGQGDFVQLLMESISVHLDRPANSLYRHQLTGHLDSAVRGSNAQYEPQHVLDRIDARLLEDTQCEKGWEVFTLEYKVSAPADVVITTYNNRQYLKLFNFLWRIKRRESALAVRWRRSQVNSRGLLKRVEDTFGGDWKTVRGYLAQMTSFIALLQNYILFEVIEKSWNDFMAAIQSSDATLDTLVSAHSQYIETLTLRGLLGSKTTSKSKQDELRRMVAELLSIIMAFLHSADSLFALSIQEHEARRAVRTKIETRTKTGQWGITDADNLSTYPTTPGPTSSADRPYSADSTSTPLPQLVGDTASLLMQIRQEIAYHGSDFKAKMCSLLSELAYQPDSDIRLLGQNMNANGYYKLERRSGRREKKVTTKEEVRRVAEEERLRTEGKGRVVSQSQSAITEKGIERDDAT